MVILSENDYLEVKLNSLIADYDVDTLTNLYQPIIGYAALSIYFTFWSEAKNQKITHICSHNQLFNRLQIAPGDFVEARKHLEAVGLLRTVLEKNSNTRIYHYELFAPKTPYSFFDDALLFGMLMKAVGETDANRFKTIYNFHKEEQEGSDISASFIDVFQPNFDDPIFQKAIQDSKAIGRRHGKINSEFNYEYFFNRLSEVSQIQQDAFTKKDMKEIERLSTLYGVGESEAAEVVAFIYDAQAGRGKHIDFKLLNSMLQEREGFSPSPLGKYKDPNLNSSSTDLGRKIKLMETFSPYDFLKKLQNNTKPAPSDLKIVSDLSERYKFPNAVINVIIDYVLATNDNILSRALCEKIGASLAREGVTTTIDAMNYLKRVRRNARQPKPELTVETPEPTTNKVNEETKDDNSNPVNWDQLLDDIDDGEGGDNGKA